MKIGSIIILAALFLGSCGVVKRGTYPTTEESSDQPAEITYSTPEDDTAAISNDNFVDVSLPAEIQERQEFLQLAYQDWKGTPYLLGGAGYRGIDCSAFMQVVFEDYFTKTIPRTTRQQLTVGKKVQKSQLQTGDMVFFKTGRRSYHVGVMVDKESFLHASTSSGVKISELNHPYWEETYLISRRIL